MKKPIKFNLLLLPALLACSITTNAQKLPNKQEISLRAPASIKIDGMATEWDNKLQASNNATEIVYTLSNDDDMLYLTVQAKKYSIANKILCGGITLNINHTLKKKDDQHVSVTYPSFDDEAMRSITNMFNGTANAQDNKDSPPITVADLNKAMDTKSKMIGIAGIKTIEGPAISVYNQDAIKAVSRFDDKLVYTYELAIPLKYLSLPNNGADAFSYQIKLNPFPQRPRSGDGPPPPPMPVTSMSTTDFWGEYTLAKR